MSAAVRLFVLRYWFVVVLVQWFPWPFSGVVSIRKQLGPPLRSRNEYEHANGHFDSLGAMCHANRIPATISGDEFRVVHTHNTTSCNCPHVRAVRQ